jgi:GLPGLI family protein
MDFKGDSTQNKITNATLGLYIGDNQSIFQDEKKYKIDSLINEQKIVQMSSIPMYRVNHVIFKDLKKSELIFSETVDKTIFGYKESIEMKWKLSKEKKTILTYECYKAQTTFRGRNYTAWYTKDIPISDGPYKFAGLPGLILEVNDDKDNFHYKLLQIIKKSKDILYSTDIHFIDRKKLLEAKINNIRKNSKVEIKFNPLEK